MPKYLNKKEEKQLQRSNIEEYEKYYNYARALYEKSKIANISMKTRKKIYPLLYRILKVMNILNKNRLKVLADNRVNTNRPKIYAVTHIGKYDIEVISEAIKEHTYILSGDFENLHRTFGGIFLEINGIVYVNERDKADRTNSKKRMIEILKNGGNILYFPEGTWNLSESKPMLKIFQGIIDVAIASDAEIIPVAIEQYGKKFIAEIGENIIPNNMIEKNYSITQIKEFLRDSMATLKWHLYESVSKWNNSEIPENYYEEYLKQRISEWPGFTLEEVKSKEYKDKDETSYEEAFVHLKKITPSSNSAFLYRKR